MNPDDNSRERAQNEAINLFDHVTTRLTSRRSFLSGAAAIGGGALFASSESNIAAAAGREMNEDESSELSQIKAGMANGVTDINILNFALLVEHFESALYENALASSGGTFDESDIERSDAAKRFSEPSSRYSTYQRLESIREQERNHITKLSSEIEEKGGKPLKKPGFDFSYESVSEFVETAAEIENIGRAAYAGVAPVIEDKKLLNVLLSIHSIEARHLAYLQVLNSRSPFPSSFDQSLSMMDVNAAIRPYLVESTTNELNKADVEYLRLMIMHHGAAVEMAELALNRTDRVEVLNLAERIIETQNDEIVEMRSLSLQSGKSAGAFGNSMGLTEIDRDQMKEMRGKLGEMEMDRKQMMRMMQDMRDLERKRGQAFDRVFLDAMIPHHETAIEESRAILKEGNSERVADLAREIIDTQTSELEQMRTWRAEWF